MSFPASFKVLSLCHIRAIPLNSVLSFIGFQLLSLGVQVTEGQPTPGREFRDSVQDFNHLGFHFIKGMFSSVNPLSWPSPSGSCKLHLGKIKITFINFSLSNNLENVTKSLEGGRDLPLISS